MVPYFEDMKLALHWKILIGMAMGAAFGLFCAAKGWQGFVSDWIAPWGKIFINMLKLIAVPLIIFSLLKGITDLKDISKLSKMGGKTLALYIISTVIAITVGLLIVNLVKPGKLISEETQTTLMEKYEGDAGQKILAAAGRKEVGPLQPLIDVVPENFLAAASNNRNMLQVIFFVILFGVGMLLVDPKIAEPVRAVVIGMNEVILKIIDLIMLAAPVGVFALLASLVADAPSADLFVALGAYSLCVAGGLGILIFLLYPLVLKAYVGMTPKTFYKGIAPAQLLAFSTSSSAATLPVTMERVTEHLGVDDEVTSFVLPIGATINMDGTSLYQGVAAVFIAQALGYDLGLGQQLTILTTALLASIGSAAVPGAGMVMLVIVLGVIGIPEAGLALIFAMDRPLDMIRTVTNVTGDATVAMIVAKSENKISDPEIKNLGDHYQQAG